MRVVFYTALFGGHDTLKEFDTMGYAFVAFTDVPVESETWSVGATTEKFDTPRLAAKFYKMHPALVAGMVSCGPGDVVIWIDASITPTNAHDLAEACITALGGYDPVIPADRSRDIAFFKHPERDNIYDEVTVSEMMHKYAGQPMREQVEAYRRGGLPDNHGLYAGGVIARRWGKTNDFDRAWWMENVACTIQDQLSLPYVLWKLGVTPGVITGSVYGTDFHKYQWTGPFDKFPISPPFDVNTTRIGSVVGPVHTGSGDVNIDIGKPPRAMRTGEEAALIDAERVQVTGPLLLSVVTPTHNTKWLRDCWESLKSQTYTNFEWVVSVNTKGGRRTPVQQLAEEVKALVAGDPRVNIVEDYAAGQHVGGRKLFAFSLAKGDVLVELDHDDILAPTALEEVAAAFADPTVGFVYSDFADFVEGDPTLQGNQTYRAPAVRGGWLISGMTFFDAPIGGVRPGTYDCVRSLPPSARAVSHVYTAPNHVRAWRKSVYEAVGGHNPAYAVTDDHELVLRTYLATKFHHIAKPLYLYRITGENTWARNVDLIRDTSYKLQDEYLERLVLRECDLLDVPAFDLGGGLYPRAGWTPVDNSGPTDTELVLADLSKAPWPWKDGSVGAFRASDLLEHLPDKMQTMNEIQRCLRPGGWLMSMTPSALGAGAFMDPTHCSYWVPGSFWYYTRDQQAQYIRTKATFREVHLDTQQISIQGELVPYVRANLVKL